MLQVLVNDEATLTVISDDANAENIRVLDLLEQNEVPGMERWASAKVDESGRLMVTFAHDESSAVAEALEMEFPEEMGDAYDQLLRAQESLDT